MKTLAVCNACLRLAGKRVKDSRCTKPECEKHWPCSFCGTTTDGRVVLFRNVPPALA